MLSWGEVDGQQLVGCYVAQFAGPAVGPVHLDGRDPGLFPQPEIEAVVALGQVGALAGAHGLGWLASGGGEGDTGADGLGVARGAHQIHVQPMALGAHVAVAGDMPGLGGFGWALLKPGAGL